MELDNNTSSEDSEEETPFSEISESDSVYLKRRSLQKRHRNSAPGSAGNSPNKKKNKTAKPQKPQEKTKSPPNTRSKSTAAKNVQQNPPPTTVSIVQ